MQCMYRKNLNQTGNSIRRITILLIIKQFVDPYGKCKYGKRLTKSMNNKLLMTFFYRILEDRICFSADAFARREEFLFGNRKFRFTGILKTRCKAYNLEWGYAERTRCNFKIQQNCVCTTVPIQIRKRSIAHSKYGNMLL